MYSGRLVISPLFFGNFYKIAYLFLLIAMVVLILGIFVYFYGHGCSFVKHDLFPRNIILEEILE